MMGVLCRREGEIILLCLGDVNSSWHVFPGDCRSTLVSLVRLSFMYVHTALRMDFVFLLRIDYSRRFLRITNRYI